MMTHKLYASVDELLAPETLTALTGQLVKDVRCLPMDAGLSGSALFTVEADGDQGNKRLVLKRMLPKSDWVMTATNDQRCRAVALWQARLLDRLHSPILYATFACAYDGDGWAMLMDDVSGTLMTNQPFTADQVYFFLQTLAALHATFWEAAELSAPELGLCTTLDLLQVLSPVTAPRFLNTASPVPQWLIEGWPALQQIVPPDVVAVLSNLYNDPQPLCTALARYPATLVHGDYRYANLGILRQTAPQAVILDWQLAGHSAATVDLAWFLSTPNVLRSPVAKDAAIAYYRQQLVERLGEHFNENCWQPLLALGQLVNVLRSACTKARTVVITTDETMRATQRRALEIYSEQVRAALRWL